MKSTCGQVQPGAFVGSDQVSIFLKTLLGALIFALLPMLLVGGLIFSDSKEQILRERVATLERVAEHQSLLIENYFRAPFRDFRAVSEGLLGRSGFSLFPKITVDPGNLAYIQARGILDTHLQSLLKSRVYRKIFLVGEDGHILYASTSRHEGRLLQATLPLAYATAFQGALREGEFLGKSRRYEDFFLYREKEAHLGLIGSISLRGSKNEVIGVIIFEMDLLPLFSLVKKSTTLGPTGDALLAIAGEGHALLLNPVGANLELALKVRDSSPPMQAAFRGERGIGVSTDYRGKVVVAAWRPLPNLGWGLVVKEDQGAVFASVKRLEQQLRLGVMGALLLSLLFAVFAARSISRPVRELMRGSEAFGRGDLSYRVESRRRDELGRLAQAFNRMARRLRELTASRDELNQEIDFRKKAEKGLRLGNAVVQSASEGIVITDTSGLITAVNPAFSRITGYSFQEVQGKNPSLLASGRHDKAFYQSMWHALMTTGRWNGDLWNRNKAGKIYAETLSITALKDAQGELTGYVGLFSDITRRKVDADRIRHQALYDSLTALPNRQLFQERFTQAIVGAQRSGDSVALLFIDLDNFKDINDSLGHAAGDCLLQLVAERLLSTVRETDTVCRLGGDEFTVIMSGLQNPSAVRRVAEQIRLELRKAFTLDGQESFISSSIGITLCPEDSQDEETLLRYADMAMYRAKEAGRNRYQFFAEEMQTRVSQRMSLERDLRRALGSDEFVTYFQPVMELASNRIAGIEALVRWQHPERGLVPPVEFISVCEETGLISALGQQVLHDACAKTAEWHKQGASLFVSVNVSPRQFEDSDFSAQVSSTLENFGLPSDKLLLEVTEEIMINRTNQTMSMLETLHGEGIHIAIDDFGSGYSSLAYLQELPVRFLKIDRSFIAGLGENSRNTVLVDAIIQMGHALGLKIIAEGAEHQAEIDFLKSHDCDYVQGYFYGKPLPSAALGKMLSEQGLNPG